MTVRSTCKSIDRLIYLTDDEIDSRETILLSRHIGLCSSCKKTREDFLAIRRMALLSTMDVPVNPDFTRTTGIRIKSVKADADRSPAPLVNPAWNKTVSVIRYFSSIAAIFLLLLFLWEQTISVRKISVLECRMQSAVIHSPPGLADRVTAARTTLTDLEWNDLSAILKINQTGFDQHDIQRIKILIATRFPKILANERSNNGLFRNSLRVKRNAFIFKNLEK